MTEDAEYIWKVTWEEYDSFRSCRRAKGFTNKREAMLFACELEDNREVRNVQLEKWFGD